MALIIQGKIPCSICGNTIGAGDESTVATPHFIHDSVHPLWRYSDSAMHQPCFLAWGHHDAFRDAYNVLWPLLLPNHPRQMLDDGSIVPIVRD